MKFLRLQEVEKRVGFKKAFIYRMIAKGEFPSPFKLDEGNDRAASLWREPDIDHWQILVSAKGNRQEMFATELVALAAQYGPYLPPESWHQFSEVLQASLSQVYTKNGLGKN